MGVRGLHTYVEGKLPQREHTLSLPALADSAFSAGKQCVVVVDGMALIRKLYTPDLEWVIGGQYQELYMNVQQFVRAFEAHGLKLVVFLDGGIDAAKLSEWQSRRVKELQKCERVVQSLQKGEEPPSAAWMPPPNISKAVGGCFSQHGVAVYYTAGEADRELANYCAAHGCAGVLGKDSDFFVLPVSAYLNLDTLQLNHSPPTVTVYRRQAVETVLSLASPLMPLLGSLVGNDFVPQHVLADWHRSVLPGRHASGSPLIEAVARRVQAAASAAHWSGPWPMSPMMWCALDWSNLLHAETRSLIERSLEQYAVSDEGFSELPTSLLERASGVSSAMLRRFRRGRLDSAVFTSATRNAIWRGPSIDDPDASPTILASRPIRCETYAACLRRGAAAGEGGVIAGLANVDDVLLPPAKKQAVVAAATVADGAASATGDGGSGGDEHPPKPPPPEPPEPPDQKSSSSSSVLSTFVSEHIIYFTQEQAGSAEAVTVPPQLVSCEKMWAMPPVARCGCLLRAMSRACRADTAISSLDAAAMLALGPVTLIVLGVRFMRRHGYAARALALVFLCQGLVMAWLAETRQRLPAELRRRPRGRRQPSLHAAHYASLFTRVSADLSVLNSACGEPLALYGPWQWFDGVVFDGMLAATAAADAAAQTAYGPASCWAALLRGDEKLLHVFELLRPLALATEAEEVAKAPGDATKGPTAGLHPNEMATKAAAAWALAIGR